MNELALFAGAGGGILGGQLLGWRTVAACELEPYPRECLLARQRDGQLERFPIWDDVCTFDGKPWRGLVDVVSGGFPCQDISSAGKGAGIEGARSGLWKEMCRIICEVRPRYAFMENSPMLTSRGLGVVLGDLAEAGYNAEWMVLGAADLGAPHQRDRIWILAEDRAQRVAEHAHLHDERMQSAVSGSEQATDTEGVCEEVGEHPAPPDTHAHSVQRPEQGGEHEGSEEYHGGGSEQLDARGGVADTAGERLEEVEVYSGGVAGADGDAPDWASRGGIQSPLLPDTNLSGREEQRRCEPAGEEYSTSECGGWWSAEPCVGRVADGVARRVDRLRAIGNGQVPAVAAAAFLELKRRLEA